MLVTAAFLAIGAVFVAFLLRFLVALQYEIRYSNQPAQRRLRAPYVAAVLHHPARIVTLAHGNRGLTQRPLRTLTRTLEAAGQARLQRNEQRVILNEPERASEVLRRR
jgi:hypothetical protein